MSYHDKNILSKIAADKTTPESILEFISETSAINKIDIPPQLGQCNDNKELSPLSSQMPLNVHCWSICNLHSLTAGPGYTPIWVPPWGQSPPPPPLTMTWVIGTHGVFAFETNPLNPNNGGVWAPQTPTPWNPGPAEYNAFYDWVVSQVGPINIGDTIVFDMSMAPGNQGYNYGFCSLMNTPAVDKICFKYEGQFNSNTYPAIVGFDNTLNSPSNYMPIVTTDNCCSSLTTPFDCLDCDVVVIDNNSQVAFVNPVLGTSTSLSYPGMFGYGTGQGGEMAKYGDKFWKKMVIYAPTSGIYAFREFQIGANCSVTHVRDVPFPAHLTLSGGPGMCATTQSGADAGGPGAQVLTIGAIQFPTQWLMANGFWPQGDGPQLAKVGLPPTSAPAGTPAYVVPIHPTLGSLIGDIVYIPSSNSHVTSEAIGGILTIIHYDSIGTVLGSTSNFPMFPPMTFNTPAGGPYTLFSSGDNVFINALGGTWQFDLTTHTLSWSSMSIAPYDSYNDGASDPSCGSPPPCDLNDAMAVGMQPGGLHHVYDVILGNPGGYFNFLTNMWNHFTGASPGPTGCDWWVNRWTHWQSQMPISNPNQSALKQAKIDFAWDMIIACGCDTPNIAPDSPDNIDSYNCVGNGRCAKVNTLEIGQFTSLSACQDNCGDGGWNCQALEGYQSCYQVSLPSIGTYATLSDCQAGFINGGLGPCKAVESWDDKDEAPPERFINPLRKPHKNKNY